MKTLRRNLKDFAIPDIPHESQALTVDLQGGNMFGNSRGSVGWNRTVILNLIYSLNGRSRS
ncbi:MAG: hypothetical protein LBM19_02730 [Holosporales bacterium]|nr:hypothetical protein [Holosporales bacterium]